MLFLKNTTLINLVTVRRKVQMPEAIFRVFWCNNNKRFVTDVSHYVEGNESRPGRVRWADDN